MLFEFTCVNNKMYTYYRLPFVSGRTADVTWYISEMVGGL